MEDFTTFEIAKKLKEKGFPQDIDTYNYSNYYLFDGLRHCSALCNHKIWWSYDNKENLYFAPTISQVLEWLREEKKLHIVIIIWGRTWGYNIIELPSGRSLHWTAYQEDIKSYEDAAIAGIEYVLDNLI